MLAVSVNSETLDPMHASRNPKDLCWPAPVSENLFLLAARAFTEGRMYRNLLPRDWSGAWEAVTALEARCLLELLSQLMFRDMPRVVIGDCFWLISSGDILRW